ncbi:MBOAT family O-acyltransferase [Aquibacillus salsiterrae]|uniref:MBOAT family protein n=1 Tax=Aquibacillus salsiterrae TaxID=2950439 RepID=A0A9X3WFT7_9BACI|nr:MBOAT family O-acyltransferase [Aquibacillus salsiterrae]MDC3416654.1 MBOAT family protein [Aquibacillus salsiterrae]
MVFSNLVFIFAFLPVVLFVYFLANKASKNIILLIASLIFYAWGEPTYVFLMIFSMVMNYSFGLLIDRLSDKPRQKKYALAFAIIGNLAILGFFKYAGFIVTNLNRLLGLTLEIEPIALPIGISFFTFQAMSYVIDVYRKDAAVQKSFVSLSLYIALFPQLVAGPIVRYNTVADQIKKRFVNLDKFTDGVKRFIIGLAKKVLLANSFGEIADAIFSTPATELSVASAWLGILAYTLQIYFDFSGYSDMAIGLGKMFGFDFLENFNYPYIAKSVTEFWRRWHISLGAWFRDYVYIPLGGNRQGSAKTIRNLLIVWTITGFWHGASWTFIAWGFYYGLFIVMERLGFSKLLSKLWTPLQHVYLLLVVMIGWVFFRADQFSYSFQFLQAMAGIGGNAGLDTTAIIYWNDFWYVFLLGMIFSTPVAIWVKSRLGEQWQPVLSVVTPVVYLMLMVSSMLLLVNSTYNPFIYFRF